MEHPLTKGYGNSRTHKTAYVFSNDGQSLLLFIDPPHLLETIQNGFINPSRKLWVYFGILYHMHIVVTNV